MKSCEIYRELNQKYGLNINTIRNWIAAIKSDDREYAKKHVGHRYMNYWYEIKSRISSEPEKQVHLKSQTTNDVRKSECLEYICESVREKKRYCEILKGIQQKYGSEVFVRGTVGNWISSIKSSNRNKALRSLGRSWMSYWNAIHHRSGTSKHNNLNRIVPKKQETTARRSSRIRKVKSEMIEVKSERIDEFDRHLSSSMESSHGSSSRVAEARKVPEKILGMVKLNGRDYFLIKSKGFFKDNLGI